MVSIVMELSLAYIRSPEVDLQWHHMDNDDDDDELAGSSHQAIAGGGRDGFSVCCLGQHRAV